MEKKGSSVTFTSSKVQTPSCQAWQELQEYIAVADGILGETTTKTTVPRNEHSSNTSYQKKALRPYQENKLQVCQNPSKVGQK